ncbi:MAG: hypothetical protein ACYCWW_19365 [Deltaproteobacteria bacterium]
MKQSLRRLALPLLLALAFGLPASSAVAQVVIVRPWYRPYVYRPVIVAPPVYGPAIVYPPVYRPRYYSPYYRRWVYRAW